MTNYHLDPQDKPFIPNVKSTPEPETEDELEEEQPGERPENEKRIRWLQESSYPDAQKHSDGISDLFTVTDEDVGASDEDLSDLTDVDIEKDVLDADEDGSLNDLVDVTEDDIMGDEIGQRPSRPSSQQRRTRYKISPRYQPPTSLGRSR